MPTAELIAQQAQLAVLEDVGGGDLTAAFLPASQRARAQVIAREAAVLCGCAWFEAVYHYLSPDLHVTWLAQDGDRITPGQILCQLDGYLRPLLTGERTALNYLQTLSGTATRARRYADALNGLPTRILDTRKTLPGLRLQQKYAVVCGGCHNHRIGLYDAILIKENHILAAGSIADAVKQARQSTAGVGIEIEIEVENLAELEQAVAAGAERILLDNFELELLRAAVQFTAGRARLEASGGITLENLPLIAATGVDDISIGDLTKSVEAIDLSMRLVD
ncbi:carboxylating nicotinate-nucleotide diphosphorylase [Thiospirillum jenense]|uniref:Probable nicotinate-nucleotide pyrophosphorylase [carboxylating] n=1 Tax=Thiospirillum jenense TaxID=1653858 RepID=A0A839HG55_9GAMM|nr:carboxylating nicotinate-nucleotide diphosphorylase [Thiospirillum jenense]MBB1127010.1 carboxylating nicotinate-nucleotide diphosphorylase [Thiospirillum jenense]